MRVHPDNQSPEIPENTTNREERRQKACALRAFKEAQFLSPAISSTREADGKAKPGCLSIQIDTFPTMPETAEAVIRTGSVSRMLSGDKMGTSRDRIMRSKYRMGSGRVVFAAHGDRNRRAYDSRRVRGGQNA